MRACASASGGVIFVPDQIKRKKNKTDYASLAGQEPQQRIVAPDNIIRRADAVDLNQKAA